MKKSTFNLIRIGVGGAFLVASLVLEYLPSLPSWVKWVQLGITLAGYLFVAYDVIFKAIRRIFRGQFLDENFLMVLASAGAFAIGEYPEALAVMLFYQVGEWFEHYAVGKSRRSINALLAINSDTARLADTGEEIPCEEVVVGTLILVRAGERIPIDGIVVEGEGQLDTASLTGESVPRSVAEGDEVMSGCILMDTTLIIRTTKVFGESTASRMIKLVEEARDQKAPVENFITTFAKYYTPIVVAAAVIVGVLPPLILGMHSWPVWATWLKRAMIFLVVSCPCALVISIPLSYFGAIGRASKIGVLVKGGHVFATLTKVDQFVMDKTGTVTIGRMAVSEVYPEGDKDVLRLALTAECQSNHPLACSVVQYATEQGLASLDGYQVTEMRGKGVEANGEHTILVGNAALMADHSIDVPQAEGTVLYVAQDGQFMGYITLSDQVKPTSAEAIERLKGLGETHLVSGDRESVVRLVAGQVGFDHYLAQCLPEDKVNYVKQLSADGHKTLFVGDGINDAPVITSADVGVAMGGIGQDAAIESADIVLMNDNLQGVPSIKHIATKTQRIVKQNIVFALGVKLAVMALSLTPFSKSAAMMWLAVGADVGVAILAILNAMRCGRIKE